MMTNEEVRGIPYLCATMSMCCRLRVLRSCGLNVRLVQVTEASYLKEVKESLLLIKTTERQTRVKQFKSFRLHRSKGDFTRVETKSSLRLNFW